MEKFLIFWALTGIFSLSFAAPSYQRIRVLETASQFESAVQKQDVILDFQRDVVVEKESDSDYAKKRIETIFPMKNRDGSLEKELIIRCDFLIETKANKVTLASTKNQSNKWKVQAVKKIGTSMERWILSKTGAQDLTLTCMSFEKKGDEAVKVSLVPSFVDNALSQISGTLLTTSKIAENSSESTNKTSSKINGGIQ
jgi:hypothetical protein